AYERVLLYRTLGASNMHWIPNEYKEMEIMARGDKLYLFMLSFKEFLLTQFFLPTRKLDPSDESLINRHAIIHGLMPPRGEFLDTVKVAGVLEALAHVVGYVTPQG